jgi:hypothetical protein
MSGPLRGKGRSQSKGDLKDRQLPVTILTLKVCSDRSIPRSLRTSLL